MDLLIASVLAVAISPEQPELSQSSNQLVEAETVIPDTTSQRSEPTSEPTIDPRQVTCPPGQFASAFSDVYPTDWAYQAVNNLASRPMQCFDLPNRESGDFPNDWTL